MKKIVFTTHSKSDYERILNVMLEKGIQYKARGDDWNCRFEIVYRWNEELHEIKS